MSRIFCIVGKSASGKDTIYKAILSNNYPGLTPVVPYTTRPKRMGEKDGADYNFVTEAQLKEFEAQDRVIEKRCYTTTQGVWTYFTLKFEMCDNKDYILITTLEGVKGIIEYYGADVVNLICLVADDRTRLLRCIERESKQKVPDYSEVCRRFLADQQDFSDENIRGFKNIYYIDTNCDISECTGRWNEIYKRH